MRLADFTAIWDYVGELQARIAQLEQYQEWAQPQIVTHGEDRIRIVQLEQLLRDVRPWMGEAPYALADRIDAVLTSETSANPCHAAGGKLDPIRLAAMHHGIRFEFKSEKDAMTLLLMLIRDGKVSVTDALQCFVFEGSQHTSEVK